MIASFPMYDTPATRAANDALWNGVRDRLGYGPARLSRTDDPWSHWHAPDLLLSQTCGLPYRTELHDKVTLVGTPDYGVPGCPPGYYSSVIVARAGAPDPKAADYPGLRLAINDPRSQSGWAAADAHATAAGVAFGSVTQTGSHAGSVAAVSEGKADLAFIDAHTWRLMTADGACGGVREFGRTEPTPGLPLITSKDGDAAALFDAMEAAISGLDAPYRAALGVCGIVWISTSIYLAVPRPSNLPQNQANVT